MELTLGMRAVWLSQRRKLQELATSVGLPGTGARGTLKDALHFGEMLTLAKDTDSARRLLHEDRAGALSFLEVIANLTKAIQSAKEQPSTSEMTGPFHELADFVVEFLTELRVLDPSKFE